MSKVMVDSRRDLRERAFQALMSLEYDGDIVEACRFAYLHDKEEEEQVELPIFLLNLVNGVMQSKSELDDKITQYLKAGWTLDRLTLVEKNILRLGLYELLEYDETPQLVAVNEAIELAKKFSDEKSSKFINGISRTKLFIGHRNLIIRCTALCCLIFCRFRSTAPSDNKISMTYEQLRSRENTMSTLWYQKAAETKALYLQGYNVATNRLKELLKTPTEKPYSIVLDLDETL